MGRVPEGGEEATALKKCQTRDRPVLKHIFTVSQQLLRSRIVQQQFTVTTEEGMMKSEGFAIKTIIRVWLIISGCKAWASQRHGTFDKKNCKQW